MALSCKLEFKNICRNKNQNITHLVLLLFTIEGKQDDSGKLLYTFLYEDLRKISLPINKYYMGPVEKLQSYQQTNKPSEQYKKEKVFYKVKW